MEQAGASKAAGRQAVLLNHLRPVRWCLAASKIICCLISELNIVLVGAGRTRVITGDSTSG